MVSRVSILQQPRTPTQLARLRVRVWAALDDNDWNGRIPRSLREYARLTGVSHSQFSDVLSGRRSDRRASRLLVMLAEGRSAQAIRQSQARQRRRQRRAP